MTLFYASLNIFPLFTIFFSLFVLLFLLLIISFVSSLQNLRCSGKKNKNSFFLFFIKDGSMSVEKIQLKLNSNRV